MPKFTYTAVTKEGKTVSGSIEATTREALVGSLNKQGVRPLVVKQQGGFNIKSIGGKPKVKSRDLVIFTRQLSTMISAGVPLNRSLATLEEQANNKYFKQVIAGIAKDVEGGISLGDAFAKYPDVFSEIYINMVRAGEAGGILDDIMKRLALQVEQDSSMRKKIKSASMYPLVISIITVIAFFGITMFIVPKFGKIITDLGGPDAELPIYTQMMLNFSTFMQNNAILIFIILGLGIFFFRRYIKTPKGKFWWHSVLLKTPIINQILMKIAIARFSRTFASLMSSGVSVLDALDVTGAAIGNKVIEKDLREAAKEIKNGKQLSEPLSKSKYFPAIVSQMLAIGEETGQIDTILVKVADFYEEEVEATIDGLSSIIEPLMIVVLGAIVGLVAASVMGPIASLSKNIGG
jgi:type IV pilus assembly protein PilC